MLKFRTPKFIWVLATFVICFLGASLLAPKVFAKYYTYPNYDVMLDVHQDSTVDVTEKLTYQFYGNFSGVIRQIPLEDASRQQYCIQNSLTCGGFERIALLGIYDQNGTLVSPSAYQVYTEDNSDTDQTDFVIKWVVWPSSQDFNGDKFTWTIKYRLYGSLGWINSSPYLYWNMLPSNKGGEVASSHMVINFPDGTSLDTSKLQVFASSSFDYNYKLGIDQIVLDADTLPADSDFTVSYKLSADDINLPGTLNLNSYTPLGSEISLTLDGVNIGKVDGHFASMPPGTHQVLLQFPGFADKQMQVTVAEGGTLNLDATLTPQAGTQILIFICLGLNIFGIFLLPLGVALMYRKWVSSGRDEDKQATIVPQFGPPTDMRPYLLGSLKDESVDKVDVTGSIIDLAYRGYIRIKELEEGKNYELTKLAGKKGDPGLDDVEKEIMEGLFGGGSLIDTKNLANTFIKIQNLASKKSYEFSGKDSEAKLAETEKELKDDLFDGSTVVNTKDVGETFYAKFEIIKSMVYQQMVDKGYFKISPQTVRRRYAGLGVALVFLGIAAVVISIVMLFVGGYLGPITVGLALVIIGIVVAIFSNFMPARTALGSKLYADVLGFRMYLYTAERYRLQKLSPEEFEKYLSYAIVFGIEKQWAEQFKDIYKGQPDWYVGSGNMGVWNVFYISNFTRSFANSVSTTMLTAPSAKGSGWSGGGGSFGGFSGGGGGGGGSGAF